MGRLTKPTSRPPLPAHVNSALGLRAGRTIVLLGAGDASLARQLGDTGARLVVADPSSDARARLAPLVPSAEIIDGVPGDIPIPQWGADAIATDESELWLGSRDSADELYRVLSPGGLVAAVRSVAGASLEDGGFVPVTEIGEWRVWRKP